MKENLNLTYHEIALALKRDDRTVWTSYNKAIIKHPKPLAIKETKIKIPINIYNEDSTVLEATIFYLKFLGKSFI